MATSPPIDESRAAAAELCRRATALATYRELATLAEQASVTLAALEPALAYAWRECAAAGVTLAELYRVDAAARRHPGRAVPGRRRGPVVDVAEL